MDYFTEVLIGVFVAIVVLTIVLAVLNYKTNKDNNNFNLQMQIEKNRELQLIKDNNTAKKLLDKSTKIKRNSGVAIGYGNI